MFSRAEGFLTEMPYGDIDFFTVNVPQKLAEENDIEEHDIVEVFTSRRSIAGVVKIVDGDAPTISMHPDLRKDSGFFLDERVYIKKAVATQAEYVSLRPICKDYKVKMDGDFANRLVEVLGEVPLLKGASIPIPGLTVGGQHIYFQVTSLVARGGTVGFVSKDTRIEVQKKPLTRASRISDVKYEDIGGLSTQLVKIRETIEYPMRHPELFRSLGIAPSKGVLLKGPPGTGKTLIAKAIANESDAKFFSVRGPEIMNKFYGESERILRDLFDEAQNSGNAVIFIDEIDSIAPKREEADDATKRIVSQLLTLMDGFNTDDKIVVIAATNRPDSLDEAIRRTGRFDKEIEIGIPDRDGRQQILDIHLRAMPISGDIDFDGIYDKTNGFTGSDLEALAREVAMSALHRYMPDFQTGQTISAEFLQNVTIMQEDFDSGMKEVEPSGLKEVAFMRPRYTLDDVGGLESAKEKLIEDIMWAVQHPEAFKEMGLPPPSASLFFGPPGTGKTLLAEGIAGELDANYLVVKGPEVLSKWVGDTEKNLRKIFQKAKQSTPCVLLFDEIDALAMERGTGGNGDIFNKILNQLLTLIDEAVNTKGLTIIFTTNRPDIMDGAILRKGRVGTHLFIGAPDKDERLHIFKIHTEKYKTEVDVNYSQLAERSNGYTGSDIKEVCREAAMSALRRDIENRVVTNGDFDEAFKRVAPSFSEETMKEMDDFKKKLQNHTEASWNYAKTDESVMFG